MTEISNLVATLGFPIVACVGLGLYISSRDKAIREDNIADKDRLYAEITHNREVTKELLETNKLLAKDIKSDVEDIKTELVKIIDRREK